MTTFNRNKFCEALISARGTETQNEFASKLSINRSTLSLLETGKQIPSIEVLSTICQLKGISSETFFNKNINEGLIYLKGRHTSHPLT